jgi:hypothetical protein
MTTFRSRLMRPFPIASFALFGAAFTTTALLLYVDAATVLV